LNAGVAAPLNAADPPVSNIEFTQRMELFAPFEAAPRLAVGVSGGSDSLALAVLAERWARARNGRVVALTVDHGLRPESGEEAAQIGRWLASLGIDHVVLPWVGPKPKAAVQATARQARRDLLLDYCRRHGVFHLLLAHQQDDQAETILLRLAADSGRDGLAGISVVSEYACARVLRPLLDLPRARLQATLAEIGQDWVDDPSNSNRRFARVAARDQIAGAGNTATTAAAFGQERRRREHDLAHLLARSVALQPQGWAIVRRAALTGVDAALGQRLLARVLTTISGNIYGPRGESVERLYEALVSPLPSCARTLGGCRIIAKPDRLVIVREAAAVTEQVLVRGSGRHVWDGRFTVEIASAAPRQGCTLQALGSDGWAAAAAADKSLRNLPIPALVKPTLPALWDLEGVLEVPHLLYRRRGADPDSVRVSSIAFRPSNVLAGAGFGVLSPPRAKL
jgi:tRNA(Ile)-lysidine synthase